MANEAPDWLELSTILPCEEAEAAENQLLSCGAMAVTLLDADDQPVLEPAPGETPLWPKLRIVGLFPVSCDPLHLLAELSASMPAAEWHCDPLAGREWEREWLRDFRPLRFGKRLAVVPGGQDLPDAAVIVRLDPGLAFGTGTQRTTALCLEWLDTLAYEDGQTPAPLADALVIDYGCGSGILAVAALRLGAAHAIAVDFDPQALMATGANAAANGVSDQLSACAPNDLEAVLAGRKADILLANILAEPLRTLLPEFALRLRPGGQLALSGILDDQVEALAACAAGRFDLDPPVSREGWSRVSGRRRMKG